ASVVTTTRSASSARAPKKAKRSRPSCRHRCIKAVRCRPRLAAFAPSSGVTSVLVRLTYLKATAVLLARHLLRTRGHDYRLALAGFLTKLGFDEAEPRETGLAIINLMADGNEQDWRTVCRTTSQKSNVVHDITEFVDDARVAQHIRAWFGVRTQQ